MICVDKDKLADLIEENGIIAHCCRNCNLERNSYCILFDKVNDNNDDRLPECKEIFIEGELK